MDYTNIPTGLKINSQIPLDVKGYVLNEATLAYLGVDDNLAFTYHDQIEIFCLEEKTLYVWREVQEGEENTGLISLDFTYPLNLPNTYGINYSGKTYNFFQKVYITPENIEEYVEVIEGPAGPQGPPGIPGQSGVTILDEGYSTSVTGAGTNSDPYEVNLENLQKVINTFPYTLTSEDDKYTIFVDNGISDVVINVPTGLINNFSVVFVQKGSGEVTIQQSGVATLLYPSTTLENKIKGQYYWVMVEKELSTNNYYLMGSLKVL